MVLAGATQLTLRFFCLVFVACGINQKKFPEVKEEEVEEEAWVAKLCCNHPRLHRPISETHAHVHNIRQSHAIEI